jgi:hypothetical protein
LFVTKLPAGILADRIGVAEFERLWQTYLDHAVTMLVQNFAVPPIGYCVHYAIDDIAELVEERRLVVGIPERPATSPDEVALRILRGLGHVEIFYWKGTRYAGLTPLGEVVRDFVKDESVPRHVKTHALILSSLPFSTKMRVVYGLYYIYGLDYGGFISMLISTTIFGYDPDFGIHPYAGVERLALEVLVETRLTDAGRSERAISETEILAMLLETYTRQFGGKASFNENIFVPLNEKLRHEYYYWFSSSMHKVAAWKALEAKPAPTIKLDEALKRYDLTDLQPLIKRLREKFGDIERILHCLYSMP